jgi:hypothetical protein
MRRRSYAIWWQGGDDLRHAGKLEIAGLHILMSGSGRVALPLDEITDAEYRAGELRIDCRGGGRVRIGSLDAPGALLEVFDSLRTRLRPSAA